MVALSPAGRRGRRAAEMPPMELQRCHHGRGAPVAQGV